MIKPIDVTPHANDIWHGIAGHFDSLAQVLCEFIDNSLSNFKANSVASRQVFITIDPVKSGGKQQSVFIRVEDSGTGISDFATALRLGDRSGQETPLNEHGFGLKHALATGNPENDNWVICTRTDDEAKGSFKRLTAPYSFKLKPTLETKDWPGSLSGTGTVVQFQCSTELFNTTQRGIKGAAKFDRCLDYLAEELGHVYSAAISDGEISITIQSSQRKKPLPVAALKPNWVGQYPPGTGDKELTVAGRQVKLLHQFGEVRESAYVRHYKKNISTSGVEIRVNGRFLMGNLFKEVWGMEPHNAYNHFLAIIDIRSDDSAALPKTVTSKNGIRPDDPCLVAIFDWIRATMPAPPKDIAGAESEKELVDLLADLKEKHIRAKDKKVVKEFKVYSKIGSPVSVDLYLFDGKDIVLYEAKKDIADVKNIYQLLMYWDGAVADGITPTEGILLASEFSPGVNAVIETLNGRTDAAGRNYNFSTKLWKAEGVPYPKA